MGFILCYILGTILSNFVSPFLPSLILNTLLLCFKNSFKKATLLLLFFQLGLFFPSLFSEKNSLNLNSFLKEEKKIIATIEGEILKSETSSFGSKSLIRIEKISSDELNLNRNLKALMFYPSEPLSPKTKFKTTAAINFPKTKTNPGQFDLRKHYLKKGIICYVEVKDRSLLHIEKENTFFKTLEKYKNFLRRKIKEDENGPILLALLLGERDLIKGENEEDFINSGLYHLIALSGLHLGLLLLSVILTLRVLKINPFMVDIIALIIIPLYLLLVKDQPSIMRASLMALLFLVSKILNRSDTFIRILMISMAIILTFLPKEIFDPAFQMTYLATFGIALLYPLKPDFFKNTILKYFFDSLFIGFSAQLFTSILLILNFQRISLIGFFFTIFATIPLFPLLLLGLIYLFGFSLIPYLNEIILALLSILSSIFIKMIKFSANLNYSSLFFPKPHFLYTLLIIFSLILIALQIRKAKLLGFTFTIILLIFSYFLPNPINNKLNNIFAILDIGQGNSSILIFNNKIFLIDCGETSYRAIPTSRAIIEPFLSLLGKKKIDGIFITHWDRDHYGSLTKILKDFKVGFVASPCNKEVPKEIATILKKKNIRTLKFKREDIFSYDKIIFYFLNPPQDLEPKLNENDLSLVMKVEIKNIKLMITGDIEKKGLQNIDSSLLGRVDILLAPHHGAKKSLYPPFVKSTSPKYVVFSVGKNNPFNHPNKDVVNLFLKEGSKILRTDKDGAILFLFEEDSFKIYRYNQIEWENLIFK